MKTQTRTVIETFTSMGVQVMSTNVKIETTDATIHFCEAYGFEHVFPEDAEFMVTPPLVDGEPFMYLWIDTVNDTKEMRHGIWGADALPVKGTSLCFKLTNTSSKWREWNKGGDIVFGNKVTGSQINVTIKPGSRAVAIGDGAIATSVEYYS